MHFIPVCISPEAIGEPLKLPEKMLRYNVPVWQMLSHESIDPQHLFSETYLETAFSQLVDRSKPDVRQALRGSETAWRKVLEEWATERGVRWVPEYRRYVMVKGDKA